MNTADSPGELSCPEMRVEARGLIFDAAAVAETAAVAYVTSLVPLESGTFLAGWQCGPGKHTPTNTIRLAASRDGAETWEPLPHRFEASWHGIPGSFLAAEMVEAEPGRLMLFTTWVNRSDPERPLFDPETEGILPTRLLVCSSTDEGHTWGDWSEIPTAELTGCAVTGPIVRWPDGTIACAFESFKEFDDPAPVAPAAWLTVSRDGGRSFGNPWRIAQHPEQKKYYWDQRLCPTQTPGEFVAMFWTHNRAEQKDANVHLLRASLADGHKSARQGIAQDLDPRMRSSSPAFSKSQAAEMQKLFLSHSQPVETSIPGQIAACCVAQDGRILAYVVDRGWPGTMTLWQSSDGGRNWPRDARLVVHTHDEQAAITQGRENIDFAAFWEDMGRWSFGHPAIRRLGDAWLLAWYAGTPNRMSIHWARIVEES